MTYNEKRDKFEKNNKIPIDHREVNRRTELFLNTLKVNRPGMIVWLEKGLILKNALKNYLEEQLKKNGYFLVNTPILVDAELLKTTKHREFYQNMMFTEMKLKKENLQFRPMSCPQHILLHQQLFKQKILPKGTPAKFGEIALLGRNEPSGSLSGLERVRIMNLVDSHIFINLEQDKTLLMKELNNVLNFTIKTLEKFSIKIHQITLSVKGKGKKFSILKDQEWNELEKILNELLIINKIPFKKREGEAAFYGPKIDFEILNSHSVLTTLATIQIDPKLYSLVTKDKKKKIIIIHHSVCGTLERLIATILEQQQGNIPFWLSPIQTYVLSVTKSSSDYTTKIYQRLVDNQFRSILDVRNIGMEKKVKKAFKLNSSYIITIGKKEEKNSTITFKKIGDKRVNGMDQAEFIYRIQKEKFFGN